MTDEWLGGFDRTRSERRRSRRRSLPTGATSRGLAYWLLLLSLGGVAAPFAQWVRVDAQGQFAVVGAGSAGIALSLFAAILSLLALLPLVLDRGLQLAAIGTVAVVDLTIAAFVASDRLGLASAVANTAPSSPQVGLIASITVPALILVTCIVGSFPAPLWDFGKVQTSYLREQS